MALSKEAPAVERPDLYRLFRYGEAAQPPLIVQPEIETAERLEAIPNLPPVDTGGPYAVFEIKNKTKGLPEPKFPEYEPVEPVEVAKPKFELIVVKFDGVDKDNKQDMAEVARKVGRGMQRAEQYEHLVEVITLFEAHVQRGESATYYHADVKRRHPRPAGLKATPEALNKLKHVAASMYAEELSKEPASKEFAKGLKARKILDEEAIVGQAVRIIEEYKKSKDPEVAYEVSKSTITETISSPKEKQSSDEKEQTPTETAAQNINEEYPDDSVSDEVVSVEFVRELYNKNF